MSSRSRAVSSSGPRYRNLLELDDIFALPQRLTKKWQKPFVQKRPIKALDPNRLKRRRRRTQPDLIQRLLRPTVTSFTRIETESNRFEVLLLLAKMHHFISSLPPDFPFANIKRDDAVTLIREVKFDEQPQPHDDAEFVAFDEPQSPMFEPLGSIAGSPRLPWSPPRSPLILNELPLISENPSQEEPDYMSNETLEFLLNTVTSPPPIVEEKEEEDDSIVMYAGTPITEEKKKSTEEEEEDDSILMWPGSPITEEEEEDHSILMWPGSPITEEEEEEDHSILMGYSSPETARKVLATIRAC
mgnify:FL=1